MSHRYNGGMKGVRNLVSPLSAGGRWCRGEHFLLRKSNEWVSSNDAYWANVTGLFQFEGANGDLNSTNLGSASAAAVNWYNATTTLSDTTAPFGATSFPGITGKGLYLSAHAGWTFGTGDFTMECWARPSASSVGQGSILSWRPGNGSPGGVTDFIEFFHSTSYRLAMTLYGNTQSTVTYSSNDVLTLNTWSHVALSRVSGVTKMFVDGTEVGSKADNNNYGNTSTTARLGITCSGYDGNYFLNGNVKDVRITKGVGRYSGAFSPQLVPFSTTV